MSKSSRPPFPRLQSLIRLLRKYDDLYTDIVAITTMFAKYNNEEWPYKMALKMLKELVKGAGTEKVMWELIGHGCFVTTSARINNVSQ